MDTLILYLSVYGDIAPFSHIHTVPATKFPVYENPLMSVVIRVDSYNFKTICNDDNELMGGYTVGFKCEFYDSGDIDQARSDFWGYHRDID